MNSIGHDGFVRITQPAEPATIPATVEPAGEQRMDLLQWARDNYATTRSLLSTFGAIRFKGFHITGVAGFNEAFTALAGTPITYIEQSSPRRSLGGNVYTSTEYDASRQIFFHNEQSYNINFPQYIAFYCEVPAEDGGETPIADIRRVYKNIDPEIRDRFATLGYIYVRNYGGAISMPWQTAFQTQEANVVESYCQANAISFRWLDVRGGKRLRTEQLRPAVARHPNGELVWFNHATFFNRYSLDDDLRDLIDSACKPTDRPHETYFGDGNLIPEEVIHHLRKAYQAEECMFRWSDSDVLLLDNMLVAHARRPFVGRRKIAVAMSELRSWPEVDPRSAAKLMSMRQSNLLSER